ncbi:MAG: TRAP transporter small permease subunit [Pseudomonadota bacterium]
MRRSLDLLYDGAGALAALFLLAIVVTVLIQVGFNIVDSLAIAFGAAPPGLVLPSYAEFTGYFLAAASFLAAAHTLRRGAMIRVALVIQRLRPATRRWVEVWCAGAGAVFAAYATYWMLLLVLESLEFGDVSPGMVPVQLWIPQSALALGLAIMTVALIDGTVAAYKGEMILDDVPEVDLASLERERG